MVVGGNRILCIRLYLYTHSKRFSQVTGIFLPPGLSSISLSSRDRAVKFSITMSEKMEGVTPAMIVLIAHGQVRVHSGTSECVPLCLKQTRDVGRLGSTSSGAHAAHATETQLTQRRWRAIGRSAICLRMAPSYLPCQPNPRGIMLPACEPTAVCTRVGGASSILG